MESPPSAQGAPACSGIAMSNNFFGNGSLPPLVKTITNFRKPFAELLEDRLVPATWTGASGIDNNWNTAANWDSNTVPGSSDTAIIDNSSDNVVVNSLFSIGHLTMSAGTLHVGGNVLTLSSSSSWSGGTITGSAGGLEVSSGATLTISGSPTLDDAFLEYNSSTITYSGSGSLSNAAVIYGSGTFTWTGSGGIDLQNSSWIDNSGTFDLQSNATLESTDSSGYVDNSSTFEKTSGSGTSTITVDFNNSGTVQNTSAGTLLFSDGTLTLASTNSLMNVTIDGADITAESDDCFAQNVLIASGTVTACSGSLHFTGSSQWTGGLFDSSSVIVVDSGATLTISGASAKEIDHAFDNYGTVNWTQGNITVDNATLLNDTDAVWTIAGGVDLTASSVNSTFYNYGTLNVGGTSNAGSNELAVDLVLGDGALAIEIAHVSGSAYDRLHIDGTASLGGTLQVSALSGVSVAANDQFTILTSSSRSGSFGTVSIGSFGTGKGMSASYTSTDAKLTVVSVSLTDPGDQTSVIGDTINLGIFASSSDSSTLTYSADGLPPGTTIDSATGVISGTITGATFSYPVTVTVTDTSAHVSVNQTISWALTAPARADPVNSSAGTPFVIEHAATGTFVNINAFSDYPCIGLVTYSLTDDAGGRFTIDNKTGVVKVADGSLIDYVLSSGSYSITVQATDGTLTSSEITFTIDVIPQAGFQAYDDYYYDGNYEVDLDTGVLTISSVGGVLANDVGASSITTISLVSTTSYGDLTFNSDGSFTYLPSGPLASYPGSDSFVYSISDGTSTQTASVYLFVNDPYVTDWKDNGIQIFAPPAGARLIQTGESRIVFTAGSQTFITNNSCFGDSTAIRWHGGSIGSGGISGWGDLTTQLQGYDNGSITDIYLSGHGGANGGVSTENGALDFNSLNPQATAEIRRVLAPGGRVIFLGCCSMSHASMVDLAHSLGVPVVGNNGTCGYGNYGYGNWYQCDP